MAEPGQNDFRSSLGNYKGVMLCARPNENVGPVIQRPFISRVDPKEPLGLTPAKTTKIVHVYKPYGSDLILKRHRAWLEEFKERIRQKKELELISKINEEEKFHKIKQKAAEQREKIKTYKNEFDKLTKVFLGTEVDQDAQCENAETNKRQLTEEPAPEKPRIEEVEQQPIASAKQRANVNIASSQELDNQKELKLLEQQAKELESQLSPVPKARNKATKDLSEKKKPKWAYSEKQLEEDEDKEVDELLQFTSSLDYEKYINDLEVKNMVASLKKRIDELRKEDDWKKKIVEQWNNEASEKPEKRNLASERVNTEKQEDAQSRMSEATSVASEKTHSSIKSLKDQIEKREQHKQEWDKTSNPEKKQATLEERIAKHIADEILRNNSSLRHVHSNLSIRRILEQEARQHLEASRSIQKPKFVENKEYFLRRGDIDPSNLPYLHRNPAV